MGSYFPNRWPLSYLNLTKNMKTYIRRQQHKKFKHQDIKRKNHHRSLGTISNIKLVAGLNRFYRYLTSPSASVFLCSKLPDSSHIISDNRSLARLLVSSTFIVKRTFLMPSCPMFVGFPVFLKDYKRKVILNMSPEEGQTYEKYIRGQYLLAIKHK